MEERPPVPGATAPLKAAGGLREAWGCPRLPSQFEALATDRTPAAALPSIARREADVGGVLERVRQHVLHRRVRVKDRFLDYDPLRAGRCTTHQFARAVHQLVPDMRAADVQAVLLHYTDQDPSVLAPQIVDYMRFVQDVDQVFATGDTEREPSTSQVVGRKMSHAEAEKIVAGILHRIALLTQTRGVVLKACFVDCERSDAVSLVCPRYSGKATPAQFRQHFPFNKDFSAFEMRLLAKYYTNEGGDICYAALCRDVSALTEGSEPQADEAAMLGASRPRAEEHSMFYEPPSVESVLGKLRDLVSERRLHLSNMFIDFDRLRRGVCTIGQVSTVFTVLRIELSQTELDILGGAFDDGRGGFMYRHFVSAVTTGPSSLPPGEALPPAAFASTSPSAARRLQYSVKEEQQLEQIEARLAKHIIVRQTCLKTSFQDFDKTNSGRVTQQQYYRIMDAIGGGLTDQQLDLVFRTYCEPDRNDNLRFVYADFCKALAMHDPMAQCRGVRMPRTARGGCGPKYFNTNGDVMPLRRREPFRRPLTR